MHTSKSANLFVPPAPYPGSKDIGFLKKLSRNLKSQIANLPQAVYEDEAWKPPLPNMPLFVMSPELVKAVLLDQADQFPHGALLERIMRPAWGEGLLLAKGDEWKMQRRAAAQAFRAGGMAALVPTFVVETQKLIDSWRAEGLKQVDLHTEMKRLAFNIIVETMLSGASEIDRETFRDKVQAFFSDISKLRISYILRSDDYHAGRPSASSPHRSELISHINDLIAHRRAMPPRGDLVDLLLVAEDPDTKTALSDVQLADNLLGFILAGYETTSAAMTWTFYLLSMHEPTEARLLCEYEHAAAEQSEELVYTRQTISEALRIYPPAYMVTRVAAQDTRIGEHKIKRGQRINIPIWAIHRNAAIWDNPHAFDPDRFGPDKPSPPRYAYMPFGAGPRICIGTAFAMTEMSVILATLLPQVKIVPPARDTVWPKTELALVPQNEMIIGISMR